MGLPSSNPPPPLLFLLLIWTPSTRTRVLRLRVREGTETSIKRRAGRDLEPTQSGQSRKRKREEEHHQAKGCVKPMITVSSNWTTLTI